MIDTFKNARRLKNAYTKNSFIYWIKTLPIIGKLIPSAMYGNGVVGVLATIYFWFVAIAGFCFTHLLYSMTLFGIGMAIKFSTEILFFKNLWFIFAIIGICVNSKLFEPSEDKYYGIMLMRMDSREYILSEMIYTAIRQVVGYILAIVLAIVFLDVPVITGLALIAFSVFGKIVGCFLKLVCLKNKKDTLHNVLGVVFTLLLITVTVYSLIKEILVPDYVICIAALAMVALGVLSFIYLWNFKDYKSICKVFLSEKSMIKFRQAKSGKTQKKTATQDMAKKLIKVDEADVAAVAVDPTLTSTASGYKYFNQIFEKRHSSILAKRTKTLCFIILILEIIAVGLVVFFKMRGTDLFDSYTGIVLAMPFVMYFINTGEVLASAMFYNCDAAMLTYNFYRKPETIVGVFKERLKTVIKHNILPAVLLAVGFCILILLSPVENTLTQCLTFIILMPSLSIFFSVHRLVIYYLLQPFTVGQEKKSSGYTLVNSATYLVVYFLMQSSNFMLQAGVSTISFSVGVFIFSIIYCAIALLLVYKLAPKRFKLH